MAPIPSFSNALLEYFSSNRIKGVDELETQLGRQPLTATADELSGAPKASNLGEIRPCQHDRRSLRRINSAHGTVSARRTVPLDLGSYCLRIIARPDRCAH
jgi:hypothetical protein